MLEWISNFTRREVDPFKWTDCKFTYFCWYYFHHFSSAILIIMSVEKCFALYFPLKTKSVCTVKTARWLSGATALILAAFNAQFFFIVERNKTGGRLRCNYINVPDSYILTYNRIDSSLYTFAPFAIMGITNLAIIYKFVKAKIFTARNGDTSSTAQALSKSSMKGVVTLVTVSVTFILLTGPSSVVFSITHYPHEIVVGVVTVLSTANHAINGVLYCIVGTRFRRELVNTLCCRKRKLSYYDSRSFSESRMTTVSRVVTDSQGAGSPI